MGAGAVNAMIAKLYQAKVVADSWLDGSKKKGGSMKKKGYAKGGTMKKKGMAKGGATMTLAKLRAAAKAKGYKLVKI